MMIDLRQEAERDHELLNNECIGPSKLGDDAILFFHGHGNAWWNQKYENRNSNQKQGTAGMYARDGIMNRIARQTAQRGKAKRRNALGQPWRPRLTSCRYMFMLPWCMMHDVGVLDDDLTLPCPHHRPSIMIGRNIVVCLTTNKYTQ